MRLDVQFFQALKKILSSMGKENYHQIIDSEMKTYLAPEIRIGMWGQFSCGKSSFINALIGKKLLPVNILELTSMVTEVSYGEKDMIFLNPDEENIQLEYCEEMATIAMAGIHTWEELKPSMKEALNQTKFNGCLLEFKKLQTPLNKVKLETPAKILKTGLIFVDLPGLSGAADHSKLSTGKIGECEMILYLNAPSRPIDSHDWDIIKKLKCDGKNKVIFGVRTKSDDLFKIHYAEKPGKMNDEEIYKFFKDEFKNEMKEIPFDDYFLVSPLAFSAISEAGGNLAQATASLKEQHKNKFRFFKETSKIEIISGYKFFQENFEKIIESKREVSKARKVRSTITAMLTRINQEMHSDMEFVTSNKRMSEADRAEAKKSLDHIKEKFLGLKDVRMKFEQMMDFKLRELLQSVSLKDMNVAVGKINFNGYYDSPEHVIKTIIENFQVELQSSMKHQDFQERIRLILSTCFENYRNSLVSIEDLLDKFSKELLSEDGSESQIKNLDFGQNSFDSISIGRDIAALKMGSNLGGLAGGFIGEFIVDTSLDTVMDSVLGSFAGFGVGTIVFGALRGLSNGRGVVGGILDGISNMFNGILAIFGNKSAEANLLLNKLSSQSERAKFTKNLADQAFNPIHASVKSIIAGDVAKALDKQNTIQLIWNRFESEEKKIAILFGNKEKDIKQRESELQKLMEMEKAFVALLNEYQLGETKLKKAA